MIQTAPIAPVVKDAILDSIRNARDLIRAGVGHELRNTLVLLDMMVVCDQHDSLMALHFADVIVGLEAGLGGLAEVHAQPVRDAVARLRMASLLLFAARRERDLDARLRDILPMAQTLAEYAEERIEAHAEAHPNVATGTHDLDTARRIARLARA